MSSDSPTGRFVRDREALERPLPQQRGCFDNGRRPLVLFHRARRRRRFRRPRRRHFRPLHRALSRRSGWLRPAFVERDPDRKGAQRASPSAPRLEPGSTEGRPWRRCSWRSPGPRLATLCSGSRPISSSYSSSRRSRSQSARPPSPNRLRSSSESSAGPARTPLFAPSGSCAPAGRWRGPSDPPSAR